MWCWSSSVGGVTDVACEVAEAMSWDLFTLKKLNISYNCVTELYEINNLKGDTKCYELNITNNPVCSNIGYREFVIYLLPNLRILDTVPIKCSERVAAKMLLEPDIFTSAQHLRTKLELWNQLALREINTETIPSDEPPVPLLVLVGTFMNGREEIAKALILKFPNQVYRCKKYTTLPLEKNRNTDHLKSVPIDEFNNMIKTGKLIFYYKEIGFFFGMCQDEISTCIVEGKIGLVDTILEAALVMKYSQLRPFLVLSVTEDVESYSEKLKNCFMDLDLWTKYNPAVSKNLNSGQKPKRWSESKPDNLKTKLSHESMIKTPRFTTSDADIMQTKECITRDNNKIHPSGVSYTSRGSGSLCSECLKKGSKRYFETNYDIQECKTSKTLMNNSNTCTSNSLDPDVAKCVMADSKQQPSPEKHRSLDLSISVLKAMSLSEFERITLLMMRGYGYLVRPYEETAHLFNDTFLDRPPISKSTVFKTVKRFEETRTVKDRERSGRPKLATNEQKSLDVLQTFVENPSTSARVAAEDLDMSHTSVLNVLHKNK
ncbi:hypothetical protein J6590_068322 [Homalodisca vitripennis]|nr:hypothetical protein J6590_068322 [Homalodisca vitripennis]